MLQQNRRKNNRLGDILPKALSMGMHLHKTLCDLRVFAVEKNGLLALRSSKKPISYIDTLSPEPDHAHVRPRDGSVKCDACRATVLSAVRERGWLRSYTPNR